MYVWPVKPLVKRPGGLKYENPVAEFMDPLREN